MPAGGRTGQPGQPDAGPPRSVGRRLPPDQHRRLVQVAGPVHRGRQPGLAVPTTIAAIGGLVGVGLVGVGLGGVGQPEAMQQLQAPAVDDVDALEGRRLERAFDHHARHAVAGQLQGDDGPHGARSDDEHRRGGALLGHGSLLRLG